MLRDVFYYGQKPNVHPREKPAKNLEDARQQSTTEHFWIINEYCDYTNFNFDFDFEFLPDEDVWAENHNNVWPSQHQKDSGTWLCNKEYSDIIIYRNDVNIVKRKNVISDRWTELDKIDHNKFDFSWHPDPTEPPYIYRWGCKYFPVEVKHVLEYHAPSATEIKYMREIAELLPNYDQWVEHQKVDREYFDMSWRPDPREPAYIYVWGNAWIPAELQPTLEYYTPGATERKYMSDLLTVVPEWDKWVEIQDVDKNKFDFSWRPDPREPPYIYTWGNKWIDAELRPTLEYHCEGATDRKYVNNSVPVLPEKNRWKVLHNIVNDSFDFSWRPDPREPEMTYVFGNEQYDSVKMPTIIYTMPNGTETKYINKYKAKLAPNPNRFKELLPIDKKSFDYSWAPDPTDPPYIYTWGNQWNNAEVEPTIEYHVEGATQRKFMDVVARVLPDYTKWVEIQKVDKSKFDFSWRPNPTSPPYIYTWGNKWIDAELRPTLEYRCDGAVDRKYMGNDVVVVPEQERWTVLKKIVDESFDFTWRPDPREPNMTYVFGNELYDAVKMPTVVYTMPGGTETKYVTNFVAKLKSDPMQYEHLEDAKLDDYSWLPDPDSPPYIYAFGNQWNKPEDKISIQFRVPGATEYMYMEKRSKRNPSMKYWKCDNIDTKSFDFSWEPNPNEPPYIYEFGTQWQKTGGPRYVVEGATEIKYVESQKVTKLPNKQHFEILVDNIDFDFSWHPDDTEEPYIYVFGNQYYNPEIMPTVRYVVPGATQEKFIHDVVATLLPTNKNWEELIPVENFDFSWVPNPKDPPYIYVFGNQWNSAEKEPTVLYKVEGATEYKYLDTIAKVKADKSKFEILQNIDESKFDFTWRPDPYDSPYIYVFGNQHYPAELMPTVKYTVEGATEEKFVKGIVAPLAVDMHNWNELITIDKTRFDFSWVPDPTSPPYIYVFGNQWHSGTIEPTLTYTVPGATEYKYINDVTAYVLPDKTNFKVIHPVDESKFDFSWRPDPTSPPYIYTWGNKHEPVEMVPTLEYHAPGATERKYMTELVEVLPQWDRWQILEGLNVESFDFTWRPDPLDPPFIYVFGNQWNSAELEPTILYTVPGATDRKYMKDVIATLAENKSKFKKLLDVEIESFDYSWRPNPTDPPYIYVFGNQWFKAEKEPTLSYTIEGATEYKYVNQIHAKVGYDMSKWEIPTGIDISDFDFTWRPDPGSPPYIYQFGTIADENDGPKYVPPNNNKEVVKLKRVYKEKNNDIVVPKYYIETTLDELVNKHPNEIFWAIRKNINYENFNFDWRPNIVEISWENDYVHVFGSHDSEITQTYFVNAKMYLQGKKDFKFVSDEKIDETYLAELFVTPDMFMIDRGNPESKVRFEKLKERYPNIQKARFLNSWVDTIYRCLNKCNTQLAWILSSEVDYTDFDFKFYPNPWQMKMVHVFGTQWGQWGNTYVINKETFLEDTKYVKIIEHLKNLNFVKNKTTKVDECLYDVYLIDHGNDETETIKQQLTEKCNKPVTIVKYRESYLDTLKDFVTKLESKKEHYIWVCSSVCDYKKFDFSYSCDPFSRENLHVFPSNNQKFGDTFLIDVNRFKTLSDTLINLEEYVKVNYNQTVKTVRLPAPTFVVENDTHRNSHILDYNFPYAILKSHDNANLQIDYTEPMSLWASHTKNIESLSTGGGIIALPQQVKRYIQDELYDYPYLSKAKRLAKSNPMDIVFLSNGEKCADENYEYLLRVTKGISNRVVRVDGVNGRAAAYHAAAEASNTPWLFTVFAKLRVDKDFDWDWQPDRLQQPKHYIFNALNPVNKLVYGHQAMIAYNKKLTLANEGRGLDFTLDDPHEVVDMLSGIAMFNTDPYSTWRTAFREVIKLKSDYKDISYDRLQAWLTVAEGDYAQDCLQGAKDGVEYYESVSGDPDQLKYSYEWSWLQDYYNRKYK